MIFAHTYTCMTFFQGHEGAEDARNGSENTKNVRTQSANSEVKSAYVWKENIESKLKHKRKAWVS